MIEELNEAVGTMKAEHQEYRSKMERQVTDLIDQVERLNADVISMCTSYQSEVRLATGTELQKFCEMYDTGTPAEDIIKAMRIRAQAFFEVERISEDER